MRRPTLHITLAFLTLAVLSWPMHAAAAALPTQELEARLDPENHAVLGKATFHFPTEAPHSFFLSPKARIGRVTDERGPLHYAFSGGRLSVKGGRGERPASPITIEYSCSFNDPLPERFVSTEEPTYGISGSISPRGTFLGSGSGWYPEPAGGMEMLIVTVSTPAGYEAVTAGRRLKRTTSGSTTSSTWEISPVIGEVPLSAGPYRVGERMLGDIVLYTYFYRENVGLSATYLDAAAELIGFYQGLFGPYPFPKFAVVENLFPTGYGFPSYTLLGSGILHLPFIPKTSLPHEIAHCWWGNGVLVDYSRGNWSEGLVTYLADYLLEERKSAADARVYRVKILTDYASLVSSERDFPLAAFNARSDPASRAIGYGKGAMVFHMVRKMIGDEAFYRSLRSVFRDRLFRPASWDDFAGAFSSAAGRDPAPFIRQWLANPGGPRLSLAGVRKERKGGSWVITGEVVQKKPLFALPLIVRLVTGHGSRDITLDLSGERTPFSFTAPDLPKRVVMDPEADLFRLLTPEEIPPSVNRVKGARRLLAVVSRNCRADGGTLGTLLESLGQGKGEIVREEEVDAAMLKGRDILWCGMPENGGFLPRPPAGINLAPTWFGIENERFASPGDSLFLTLNNPFDRERAMALFLPLSKQAARESAARIIHYGGYGYLVFSAGEMRRKGKVSAAADYGVFEFGD